MQPINKSIHQTMLFFDQLFYESPKRYRPLHENLEIVKKNIPFSNSEMIQKGDFWTYIKNENSLPDQGWKIHVSANMTNSKIILDIVSEYCISHKISFKFLSDDHMLIFLNGKNISRGSAGKFITIYPKNTTEFKKILSDLYSKLKGFEGPFILSDRRYKDCKVLYYRYGGIINKTIINEYGIEESILRDPNGNIVNDDRVPYWNPPHWVEDIVTINEKTEEESYLTQKYQIHEAVKFSVSGGVYKAINENNERVIIKEARPHTVFDINDYDSVDRLKNEYYKMRKLYQMGLTSKPIELFKEWEHLFLVKEYIDGENLGSYCNRINPLMRNKKVDRKTKRLFFEEIPKVWKEVVNLIERMHNNNLIISDLSPNNFMIEHSENGHMKLYLVDLEDVLEISSDKFIPLQTPGYFKKDKDFRSLKEREVYNLGYLFMGTIFPINNLYHLEPNKVETFLESFKDNDILPNTCWEVIRKIFREDVRDISVVKLMLAEIEIDEPIDFDERKNEIVAKTYTEPISIVSSIFKDADLQREDRLIPSDPMVFYTNPLSIAYGSLGILVVLKEFKHLNESLFSKMINWSLQKRLSLDNYSLGFYTGLSGIAWGYEELGMNKESIKIINEVNQQFDNLENKDIFYGLAGIGITNLYFYKKTGDKKYLDISIEIGERLLGSRMEKEGQVYWIGKDGETYLGYGRGSSGISLFMLYLYMDTSREEFLNIGRKALLFDIKHMEYLDDGSLSLPRGEINNLEKTFSPYLYDGSSGVGEVLLRYLEFDKDSKSIFGSDTIVDILKDSMKHYVAFPGLMRGFSGLGHFLLDYYFHSGDKTYLTEAFEVGEKIDLFAVDYMKDMRKGFPGEQLYRISHDFVTGGAGIVTFLNRLQNINERDINPVFFMDKFYRGIV